MHKTVMKTFSGLLAFRNIADLNRDLKSWVELLPDFDVIAGIPRSGLLVATLLALRMNKPVTDINGLVIGHLLQHGQRLKGFDVFCYLDRPRKILVIDDSLCNGENIAFARKKLVSSIHDIKYAAVYVKPENKYLVDFCYSLVPIPRVFEWNLFHSSLLGAVCMDIDGVLCRDPSHFENDDGKEYKKFILNVNPCVVPSKSIRCLATNRLEKYRDETKQWLQKHNIRYHQLIMCQEKTAQDRRFTTKYAEMKIEAFIQSGSSFFVESSRRQAEKIAVKTKRTVICTDTFESYNVR